MGRNQCRLISWITAGNNYWLNGGLPRRPDGRLPTWLTIGLSGWFS